MRISRLSILPNLQSYSLRPGKLQLCAALQRTTSESQTKARAEGQRDCLPQVQAGATGCEYGHPVWRTSKSNVYFGAYLRTYVEHIILQKIIDFDTSLYLAFAETSLLHLAKLPMSPLRQHKAIMY